MRALVCPLAVVATGLFLLIGVALVAAVAPANEHFQRTWARTDQPVLDGTIARTWIWGPEANTAPLQEAYAEAPGGERTVQYFDKSRMEINNPEGDPASPFYVTNGLLVVELMTGRMQLGDDTFVQFSPSTARVAGDQDDPDSPTYVDLAGLRDVPPLDDGATITWKLNPDGSVVQDEALAAYGVTAAHRLTVPGIDHQVALPFWTFLNSTGPVIIDGSPVSQRLFDPWFYATGYPITEAYWADVKVAGSVRLVLMQCFERRCLTYTPGNPEGFLTEAGNVGQHYYTWRYEQVPGEQTPTATATTTATPPATATMTATPTVTPTVPATVTATVTATPDPPDNYAYVTRWGGPYSPIDLYELPWSLAFDEAGNVWMVDQDSHRVVTYDSHGVLVRTIGSTGSGPGQFQYPAGIAIDNGLVFVTDTNNGRVQVFTTNGAYQYSWGTTGTGNGQFKRPFAVTVHNETVYVADSHNHRVQYFSIAGVYQGQFGTYGTGAGQFNVPIGMAFGPDGNLFVVDSGNARVQVFTSTGTYIRQFGAFGTGPGNLYFPHSIVFDDGVAYITNGGTGLVQTFSAAGTYIGQWPGENSQVPPSFARAIAIDADGNVYLAGGGYQSGRIIKFTGDGELLFEVTDSRRGRFHKINGIAVDEHGALLVVDPYIDRPTLARYSNTGTPLNDLSISSFGSQNSGEPLAVTPGNDGYIFVATGGVNRILKVNMSGGYTRLFGGTGSGPGQLNMPSDLATDAAGNLYVADSGNNRIQKFDADGNYIAQWGSAGTGPSQFDKLHGITVHGNRLYAADFGNNRVQVFDLNGAYIGAFGEPGDGPGQMSFPSDVAVNEYGYILVVEHGNSRVQLFNSDWQPVARFGGSGAGPGQFSGPMWITIDEDGYVYVSDIGNYAIHKFRPVD